MHELPDIDENEQKPLNQKIADVLRREIESGALVAGDRVPGENALIERYGVSRWVAREALADIANQGLVTKIEKVGTFVRAARRLERKPRRYRRRAADAPFASEVRAAGLDPNIEATSKIVEASAEVAERLGVEPGVRVMRTDYRFLASGTPIQTSISYEPLDITEGTDVERPEEGPHARRGVLARMDAIGVRITHVSEDVEVRPPSPGETKALNIPSGVHVFEIRRTHSTDQRAVEIANIVIPGDRYFLSYQFAVPDEDDPATD